MGIVGAAGKAAASVVKAGAKASGLTVQEEKFAAAFQTALRRASGFSFRSPLEVAESTKLARASMERVVAAADDVRSFAPNSPLLKPMSLSGASHAERAANDVASSLQIGWYTEDVVAQRLNASLRFLGSPDAQKISPQGYERLARAHLKLESYLADIRRNAHTAGQE